MFRNWKEKYIGDREFYSYVLKLLIPMILQNLITNFVSMLDNIMVGQIGTEQMNGVSIVNQFMFIFNITVFGAVSGPSIFGAQFYGKGDAKGQRDTVRFRLILGVIIIAIASLIFYTFDTQLISLYISKDDGAEAIAATLAYGKQYMSIMIVGLIPFCFGQVYSSALRECGLTRVPMLGSLAAVGINLVLDYGLIFGKLGMPCLGVAGAAYATVISKCIEALVVIFWTHLHSASVAFVEGLYRSFRIPAALLIDMVKKGFPLLINEFLWSAGMSIIAQCYSIRGLDVVAARNISGTITNLFSVVYIQMGGCIAIILGAKLGAGKLDEARDLCRKLIFFAVSLSLLISLALTPVAKWFPSIYNTSEEIRALATYLTLVQALAMPLWSFTNSCYFVLRSGGKTGITFLFDFVFSWVVMIPLAFVLSYFTKLDIHLVFAIVTYSEIIKVFIGYFMVRSGIWIVNIVGD